MFASARAEQKASGFAQPAIQSDSFQEIFAPETKPDTIPIEDGYQQLFRLLKRVAPYVQDPRKLRDYKQIKHKLYVATNKEMNETANSTRCWFNQEAVSIYDKTKVRDAGFVLYSEMYKPSKQQDEVEDVEGIQWTYLVNLEGRLVHSWYTPMYPSLFSPKLLSDGNLLRMAWGSYAPMFIEERNSISYVQEMDWNGFLNKSCRVASADALTVPHHDVWKTDAGTYLMPVWKRHPTKVCIESFGLDPDAVKAQRMFSQGEDYGCMMDGIQEFQMKDADDFEAECDVVWEWWVSDHYVQDHDSKKSNYGNVTAHPELLDANYVDATDENYLKSGQMQSLHINSITYNEELKQILVSSFVTGEVYIVEHTKSTEDAAAHKGGVYGMGGDFLYRAGNPSAYRRDSFAAKATDVAGDGTETASKQRLFYKCHTAQWIPKGFPGEGHLLVFSNGFMMPQEQQDAAEKAVPLGKDHHSYSAAVEFKTPFTHKDRNQTTVQSETSISVSSSGLGSVKGVSDEFPEGKMLSGSIPGLYNYDAIEDTAHPFGGELAWVWNAINDVKVLRFGGVERLQSGNTFVTMSNGETGWRLMEVTPDGEVVWRMRPPSEAPNVASYASRQVFRAHRYPMGFAAFKNRTMDPICSPPIQDRISDFVNARIWNPPSEAQGNANEENVL
ncbi:hypothetical protein CYMTET_3621 [Cymbomonas tetramitiformis]|uniref:Uncharacterized protein n=1 Tax=Cymbomonas tetramitiformis TaxID=36881 RepID=A0AAE0H4Q7_9CHLO|nr:hypothetical protein CYMTET_3621 [Cymbomonas tetramitiformis]